MRFSSSNFVAAATAAGALLLAACAGHGVVPAANSFAPPAFSPDAIAPDTKKATPSPCTKTQTPWVFGGACGTVTLTTAGGTAKMSGYKGFAIQANFSTGAKAGTVLMVRDAVGKDGDAAGKIKGAFFPHFTKFGLPQSLTTVTPILYLKVLNLGGTINFKQIPAIQVTSAAAYPGNECLETRMTPSNNTWQEYPVNFGTIAGHVVKFPVVTQKIQVPKNGTIYIAIACYNKKG